ncbi:recombinase family protein [Corynebacterium qintianiae]|uniref:recombinase family protein n=1 Tax=Corynebacterium qintianiae TaxID=2709392 RepID=UPI0013EAFBBF|nr:recombinase family protein [Corynebacterium qintianiae]
MSPGQILGYARVSSADQHADRQLDAITNFSTREYSRLDMLYVDKASGKSMQRPQFMEMDRFARAGDTVVIHSPDRLARSLKDLIAQLDDWRERSIEVRFITQPAFDQQDATGNLTLQILGAVSEFERALILERQREGIAAAKARGKYKETRKLTPEQAAEIRAKHINGVKRGRLAQDYSVSGSTIYNVVRGRGIYGTSEYGAARGTEVV